MLIIKADEKEIAIYGVARAGDIAQKGLLRASREYGLEGRKGPDG